MTFPDKSPSPVFPLSGSAVSSDGEEEGSSSTLLEEEMQHNCIIYMTTTDVDNSAPLVYNYKNRGYWSKFKKGGIQNENLCIRGFQLEYR